MTLPNDRPSAPGGGSSSGQESRIWSVRLDDSACLGSCKFWVHDETTLKTLFMQTMVSSELLPCGLFYATPAIKAQLHVFILQTAD
jgi:hypothetical protein